MFQEYVINQKASVLSHKLSKADGIQIAPDLGTVRNGKAVAKIDP